MEEAREPPSRDVGREHGLQRTPTRPHLEPCPSDDRVQVDAFVSNGTLAAAYLRRLGVDESRIVTSRLPSSGPGLNTPPRVAGSAASESCTISSSGA